MTVFSTTCSSDPSSGSRCTVPDPYDEKVDQKFKEDGTTEDIQISSFLYNNDTKIKNVAMTGTYFQTFMNITEAKYLRFFNNSLSSYKVNTLNSPFNSSIISGYLGFAPYQVVNDANSQYNGKQLDGLLSQLVKDKKLDK